MNYFNFIFFRLRPRAAYWLDNEYSYDGLQAHSTMPTEVVVGLSVGIAFVVLFSLIFGQGARNPNSENIVITIDHTSCFGFCPDYSLTTYGNGTVLYDGHAFVATKSKKTAAIPREDVQELVRKSIEIDYFHLRNSYTASVSNIPTTTTSVTMGQSSKKVIDYYGAPASLRQFENMIYAVATSEKWTKCPSGQHVTDPTRGCS